MSFLFFFFIFRLADARLVPGWWEGDLSLSLLFAISPVAFFVVHMLVVEVRQQRSVTALKIENLLLDVYVNKRRKTQIVHISG